MSIHLRNLKRDDAASMLEWMRDSGRTCYLRGNYSDFTIEDCEKFIFASAYKISRRDFAIADENDKYMGFTALKDIDDDEKTAEISILLMSYAEGKGLAGEALRQLMRIGFYGMRLNMLYCYTENENIKAVRLFEGLGFERKNSGQEGNLLFYIDRKMYRFLELCYKNL